MNQEKTMYDITTKERVWIWITAISIAAFGTFEICVLTSWIVG